MDKKILYIIKLNDITWINPYKIQYIIKNDFVGGYTLFFQQSSLYISTDEFKKLEKYLK